MLESKRIYFMDSLRAITIFLVIVLHASLAFVTPPFPGFVHDPRPNNLFYFIVFTLEGHVMMSVMFFVAGFFMLKSLYKKGPAGFIKGKLLRLGIPFIAGSLILAPLLGLTSYYSDHNPVHFISDFLGFFQYRYFTQYQFWFLGILMTFFLIMSILYLFIGKKAAAPLKKQAKPSPSLLIGLFIITTALSFIINLFVKNYEWTMLYIIQFQTIKIPIYISYFLLGIYAYRKGWFENGYTPNIYLWAPLFLISSIASFIIYALPLDSFSFWKLIHNSVISLQIMSALFTLLSIARKTMDKDTLFLREISRSSFTVYIIHLNILFMVVYFSRDLMIPSFMKFLLQAASAAILSWITALLLIRIPGLRIILDESGRRARKGNQNTISKNGKDSKTLDYVKN